MINLEMRLPHIGERGEAMMFMAPPPSREEELAAARIEAAAEARAEAEAAGEECLARLRLEHADALAAARRTWCEEEGEQLAASVASGMQAAVQAIGNAVAETLLPFIGTLVPEAAVRELEEKIVAAAATDLAGQIRLSGPRDLALRLADGLAARGFEAVSVQGEQPELQAECGELLIRTRMASWLQALRGASHG